MSFSGKSLFGGTLQALERLEGAPQVPPGYLAFRMALCRAQQAACERLVTPVVSLPLRAGMLHYDPSVLAGVIAAAADCPGMAAESAAQLRHLAAQPLLLPALAEAAMFGPGTEGLATFSENTGVDQEALLFHGRACGAPYAFVAVRSSAAGDVGAAPESGLCPYCGTVPGLSLVRGEPPRRFLICSLCGRDWEFPSMQCPFCTHKGALETIQDQGRPGRFIEGCGGCRRYLKVIQAPGSEGEALFPLAESVALLYLDVIAENEGYTRGVPYVAPS